MGRAFTTHFLQLKNNCKRVQTNSAIPNVKTGNFENV